MIFLQFKLNYVLWDKRLVKIGLILLHAFVYNVFYWSIQYWRFWCIYRFYVVHWRSNNLLLPQNLYSEPKGPLFGCGPFSSDQTNTKTFVCTSVSEQECFHHHFRCYQMWLDVLPEISRSTSGQHSFSQQSFLRLNLIFNWHCATIECTFANL